MNKQEKQLLTLFRKLGEDQQTSLMHFAEFLQVKAAEIPKNVEQPKFIEPKPGETVVGALKRLSASYFMLDKATMLNETSSIMAQHIMQGREKAEVIEELETLFKTYYERYQASD